MAMPSDGQQYDTTTDEPRPIQSHGTHVLSSCSDSDEPSPHPSNVDREDEADQVVGVSMGFTQSRMKARQTPAEEKTRAMEQYGEYFDALPVANDVSGAVYLPDITAEPDSVATETEKSPAPGQLPKDAGGRSRFTRSVLRSSLPHYPRSRSGDSANNGLKKFLPDLGSLARRPSLSFRQNPARPRDRSSSRKTMDKPVESSRECNNLPTGKGDRLSSSNETGEPVSGFRPVDYQVAAKHSYTYHQSSPSVSGTQMSLKRSSSDQSLYLRSSSTSSSLDEKYQFENVHSQVNVRLKAIKDSLQDSGSRLLVLPAFSRPDVRGDSISKQLTHNTTQRHSVSYSDSPYTSRDIDREKIPRSASHLQQGRTNPASLNPDLAEAMSSMTGDVVIMGGYRGSILRSAKPPHRQLWVPVKVGLNLRKVDLEVGLSHDDEERMKESIIPSGTLSHIGPVDICRRLIRRLQKCENAVNGDLRVRDYGYDWRLSPHLLARQLLQYVEKLPCNAPGVSREKRGAYIIAHSLGGLIVRHAVNQRPELFAGVIYAGVPQHCVNILGPLRDGDDVLLSSRVLTAQVNFTFRTSYVFLPEDGRCFFNKQTKQEYPVDFFDPQSWNDYHFSPCINAPLSPGKGFKDNLDLIGKRFSTVLGGKDIPYDSDDHVSLQRISLERPQDLNVSSNSVKKSATTATPETNTLAGSIINPSHKPAPAITASTIPRDKALGYLSRTLAEALQFKKELAFNPKYQSENRYPPFAVLFAKSIPTVYGARVWSREHIKYQDAYDDLAFAAGDGVCLASAAMLPSGYRIIRDGLVKSERGHVGLLGDLDGVGKCLQAIFKGRREGVGLGNNPAVSEKEDPDTSITTIPAEECKPGTEAVTGSQT